MKEADHCERLARFHEGHASYLAGKEITVLPDAARSARRRRRIRNHRTLATALLAKADRLRQREAEEMKEAA